jgi:hypothetical protein
MIAKGTKVMFQVGPWLREGVVETVYSRTMNGQSEVTGCTVKYRGGQYTRKIEDVVEAE